MLTNKICLITGASGGLGKTVVRKFIDNGATVVAVDASKASDLIESDRVIFHSCNILDESSVRQLMHDVTAQFKRLDVVLNLVGGIYPWSNVTEIDTGVWDKTIELNLKSVFLCSREALKVMISQRSGKIVNVGAGAGLKGGAQAGPYGAAKAGVINLTETMAEENKIHNIQINAIIPSIIDTPANRKSMPDADFSKWVRADEIAELLLFLASDTSSGVTGSIIKIPGRV
ncbi:SDR family oxidoreductase [bacterium]|nr:SDR family oxidoreductase [bacterium]